MLKVDPDTAHGQVMLAGQNAKNSTAMNNMDLLIIGLPCIFFPPFKKIPLPKEKPMARCKGGAA